MKRTISTVILLVAMLVEVVAQQSKDKNYVLSRVYKQAGANENDVSKVNIEIQYLDGLGRPLQNVQVQRSPSGEDIISTSGYDSFGRLQKSYLPYTGTGNGAFHSGAGGQTEAWYTANNANLTRSVPENPLDVSRPYTETFYEPSPLGRTDGEQEPGGFSNKSEIKYGGNGAAEVKKYSYSEGSVTSAGNYGAGTLTRIERKDEQNRSVVDFRDKYGKLICNQVKMGTDVLCTYYIYNDLLQLRAILQPNFQDDNSVANSAFTYDYDDRGRIIASRTPGRGVTETVYDNFDRPVLTQNANQAPNKRWSFIKYDAMNRVAFTGEIDIASSTRATLQTQFNQSTAHHETKLNSGIGYSLNATLPTIQEAHVLNVKYYDNYDYPGSLPAQNSYSATKLDHPKGYSTGGKARLMGSSTNFVTTSLYYDQEYRIIESVRELYDMGAGAVERVSYKYKFDIAPVVSEEKTEETVGGNAHSIVSEYSYDHADRLLSVKETVTVPGKEIKTAYTLAQRFNPVGNLAEKWLHSYGSGKDSGTKFRRRTNITSNIRGWQTDFNTAYRVVGGSIDLSYYKFNLSYWNGTKYSNGNISAQKWSWKDSTDYTDGLSFTYDDADRLRESSGLFGYLNTESGITYDKNGNIKKLTRSGYASDDLTYEYGVTGNRLGKITNSLGNGYGVKSAISDYEYDEVGNMTSDGNRGAKITYNKIDLPQTVKIGTNEAFTYTYDATGKKHKYVAGAKTIKYAGKFEYDGNNTFKRVSVAEGQVVPSGDSLRFDYYLKDHLGNVRVVVDEYGHTLQETDYYPYGLAINKDGRAQVMRDDTNSYLYNGKEKQLATGLLDYGARMYDPNIGRWMVVDPLSGISPATSAFSYSLNNPVTFVDKFGLFAESNTETIEDCSTCPADSKYDPYRDSPELFTYDKETGIVLNGNGEGATVKGKRPEAPVFGWPWWADMGIGSAEYRLGEKIEQVARWDGTYRYPKSILSQEEINAKAIARQPLLKSRPVNLIKNVAIQRNLALKVAKALKVTGYVTAAMGAIDVGSKLYFGNITPEHAITTLVIAGATLATGGVAAITIGAVYAVYEDEIWKEYDKANATNFIDTK